MNQKFLDRLTYKSIGYAQANKASSKNEDQIDALKQSDYGQLIDEIEKRRNIKFIKHALPAPLKAMSKGDEFMITKVEPAR